MCISNSDAMKKFLLKVCFAAVCFSTLIVIAYFILHGISEKSNSYSNNEVIYVWGDSQMIHGLDLSLLRKRLGKQVLSSANHGASVYDFLVSTKNVPHNSVCIVSFSEASFFRNPKSDYNRTGFELSCLEKIHQFGCPLDVCMRISNLNRNNVYYSAFGVNHTLFSYSDSLVYPEPLPVWHSLLEEEKEWFSWKAKAYKSGLQCLYDKHSQMILVQFPFDKQVESFAKESINRYLSDSIKQELIEKFDLKYDTIVLKGDSLFMHDLSHMNKIGARSLTAEVADILLEKDTINNYFLKVTIR